MRAQIAEKMVRIRNLKDLLQYTIRIGEGDIGRKVKDEIHKHEKELRILKVRMDNSAETSNKNNFS
jgi:RNA-binding protein YhbY